MKKFFLYILLPIIILVLVYLGFKSITGKSTYNSLYLIPEDAALIIESEDIFNAWDAIIHSDAWYHLQNIESLGDLNNELLSIDSVINNNRLLFKILGNRKITFSYHQTQYHHYDFLLVTDIGKAARVKNIAGLTKNLLGENTSISSRKYLDNEIIEIHDKASGEIMFLTLLHDKAVFSYSYLLVEQAIKEQSQMRLARNMKFLEVYEKVDGKGLLNIYISKDPFLEMLDISAGMDAKELNKSLKDIFYAGLHFNITHDGLICLEGYASYNDTVSTNVFSYLNTGKSEFYSADIIPSTIASAAKINIDDPVEFFHQSLKQSGDLEYIARKASIEHIEKRFDINVEENLLSWMEKEIVLVQTKPSNLGKANEFAAIIHTKNEKAPRKNLELIYEQIKKNSPAKIKRADYQGFEISYISLPGILKLIFGKVLDKIEMPYITQIKNNVIISNHPQVLKNIIDDYLANQTLESNIDYYNFFKNFKSQSGIGTYIEVPVAFTNLQSYFDAATWSKINKNSEYISSFSQAALYLDNINNLFHFDFKAKYNRNTTEYTVVNYNLTNIFKEIKPLPAPLLDEHMDEQLEEPIVIEPGKIYIKNLDETKHEQYFKDSILQLTVELKGGLKHGTFKEYYKNGNMKIKGKYKHDLPDGKWKYYTEDGGLAFEKEFEEGIELKTEQ